MLIPCTKLNIEFSDVLPPIKPKSVPSDEESPYSPIRVRILFVSISTMSN